VRITVRKTLSAFRFASFALCALSLVGIRAYGQGRETGSERMSGVAQEEAKPTEPPNVTDPQEAPPAEPSTIAEPEAAQPTEPFNVIWLEEALPIQPSKVIESEEVRPIEPSKITEPGNAPVVEHPNGIVQDWSNRHVIYPRFGAIQTMIALQKDPRALLSWQAAWRKDWLRYNNFRNFHHTHTSIHADWNISLGAGTTAPAMYPAKFTFDPNAVPNCATDFIVFPVNATGSSSQPNIVGLNNLYSGTAGTTGICNAPIGGRPGGADDDGVSATTMWSYNITASGGQVPTSPALSLDGAKVAFVESASGTTAHFHVLAWKSGDGVDTVDGGGLQNVLKPVTINSGFAILAPVAGSGKVTDLVLGSTSDTLSSPFVDYNTDKAYIGNDSGVLFRVKDVFCPTTVPVIDPACSGGSPPAPSLDATWGTGGALTTGCPGKLSGAVVDPLTGNIFVGCSNGMLYGFTPSGGTTINPTLPVGDGSATGGIVDPPLIDAVNGFLYVEAGSSSGGTSVLVQAKTDTSSAVTATLAAGGAFNMHAPAFNDNYFSNITPSTWLLYALAPDIPNGSIDLYGITFNGSHVMTSGIPANIDKFGIGTFEISPATEFLTTSGTPEDRLFESVLNAGFAFGDLASFNISSTFPSGLENFSPSGSTAGDGTSGIVVDNASALGQADSIYYGSLVGNKAVKLTQSGLL